MGPKTCGGSSSTTRSCSLQRLCSRLAALILRDAVKVQVAWCSVEEIDRWNILHAAMVAMRRALEPFQSIAQAVLVDGHISPFEPRYQCPPGEAARLGFTHVDTLVKGDQRSRSIAAASIVAKVHRDRWMAELSAVHPGYGFEEHKGYSSPRTTKPSSAWARARFIA